MDTISKNNKLIAEFMGARVMKFKDGTVGHTFWNEEGIEGRYGCFPNGATNYFDYKRGYNDSWDWLMTVVEKINNFSDDNGIFLYEVNINATECIIEMPTDVGNIKNEHGATLLEMVYIIVVEFIKWYNENK